MTFQELPELASDPEIPAMDSTLLPVQHPIRPDSPLDSRAQRPLRHRIGGFRTLGAAGDARVPEEVLTL